jgi:4-nitrophenyl phosphatase
MQEALDILGLKAEDVVVVGDQIDVDVKAGKAINATTLLVLSGVTTRENLQWMMERFGDEPDYILSNLGELFK